MNRVTVIAMFLVSGLLLSCSADKEQLATTNSIEGKWKYNVEGMVVNNQVKLFDYQHAAGGSEDVLEIKANGEINDIYYFNDNSSNVMRGVWFKEGNFITVSFDDQVQVAEIVELSATTLKLQYFIKESKYIKTFKRLVN